MKKWLLALSASLLTAPALFAQGVEEAPPAQEPNGSMHTIVMIVIAILFFYFILWRPEQKRRKAMETQRSSLKKGDRITAMGIVGTIVRVQTDSPTVIVKMYDGSKIELLKAAITEVHPGSDDESVKEEPTKVEPLPSKGD